MVVKAAGEIECSRLQKAVFLLREQYGIPLNFGFTRYFYGPYSEDVEYSIQVLEAFGLLEKRKTYAKGYFEYFYKLTENGERYLRRIHEKNEELQKRIEENVGVLNNISLGEADRARRLAS